MRVNLFQFQNKAVNDLREKIAIANGSYRQFQLPQVVSFTAPTGSGKTVIMTALMEGILYGTDRFVAQPEAIFVWLSDSPSLNLQSKEKIDMLADRIKPGQCEVIEESSFDREVLEDGKIYFLNTQKLGRGSRLVGHGDGRQYTIWETLKNTAEQKSDRLYIVIDEAHRGSQGTDAGRATSIMQKFIKGSERDGLPPMPMVIGMSATIERFNRLVEGTARTIHYTIVDVGEVRRSGLLKDRIILVYPPEASNDMTILQAAADEWKKNSEHWEQYYRIQKSAVVKPILLVQVQNTSNNDVTATDLRDVIKTVQDRTGVQFENGEVVHTFGTHTDITVNGLTVCYAEPNSISDDKKIRVVFYKENLSTGWDCPRAEVMMSFRKAEDATYIAQLLGRMIRTPLQQHIEVDDYLNEVYLYVPHFNRETAKHIVDELKNIEGGELPTYVDTEEYTGGDSGYWTVEPRRPSQPLPGQTTFADIPGIVTIPVNTGSDENERTGTEHDPTITPPPITIHPHPAPVPQGETPVNGQTEPQPEPSEPPHQTSMQGVLIDRRAILDDINGLGMLNYKISITVINDYIKSLHKMATLLVRTGFVPNALNDVQDDIVEMIHAHAEELKRLGRYEDFSANVLQLQLSQQIFDAFGNSIDNYQIHGTYTTSDVELERQKDQADRILGDMSISDAYGRKYYDEDRPDAHIIDVILFAANEQCMTQLGEYAKEKFNTLCDENRARFTRVTESFQREYGQISSQARIVSPQNLKLPEYPGRYDEPDGKRYENHLYVNNATGYAKIKLNSWEEAVIREESGRSDFVCWLRNPPNKPWSLCIPYEMDNTHRAAYPDFIIVRHDVYGNYVYDILEPHASNLDDSLSKAKGFAKYAEEETKFARIEMIQQRQDAAGQWRLRRLDLAKRSVREKVLNAYNNEQLRQIFDTHGYNY